LVEVADRSSWRSIAGGFGQEYHVDLTLEIKRKILGGNAARLYGIEIPAQAAKLSRDGIGAGR
jgi:hypothetical protein